MRNNKTLRARLRARRHSGVTFNYRTKGIYELYISHRLNMELYIKYHRIIKRIFKVNG